MAIVKVAETYDIALDWLVAKAEGKDVSRALARCRLYGRITLVGGVVYSPSTDWAQGGPIIERERITLRVGTTGGHWVAFLDASPYRVLGRKAGLTPLIAAMRCYVATKLGDEVEVPTELLQ